MPKIMILGPYYFLFIIFPPFLLTGTHRPFSVATVCPYLFSTNTGTKLQLSLVKTRWEKMCSWVLCNGQCVLKKNIWGGKVYTVVWRWEYSSHITAMPPSGKAQACPLSASPWVFSLCFAFQASGCTFFWFSNCRVIGVFNKIPGNPGVPGPRTIHTTWPPWPPSFYKQV